MGDDVKSNIGQDGVPDAISRFFDRPGGHSLIIRGAAGSGKTTLALELMQKFGGKENGYYVSSRSTDETLIEQFPWMFKDGDGDGKDVPFTREKLNKLEGLVQEGLIDEEGISDNFPAQFDGDSIMVEIGMDLPEVELAYQFAEEKHPDKVLIIFDSVDGLSERYGISKERLMQTVQYDLVEKDRVNVIFILEQRESTSLDYLGDGVIELSLETTEGRVIRSMKMEKLRGTYIRGPTRAYSLVGGRFFSPPQVDELDFIRHSFVPNEKEHSEMPKGFYPMDEKVLSFFSNPEGFFTSGVHLIVSKGASDHLSAMVESRLAVSSIKQGWGVAWVPSRRSEVEPMDRLPSELVSTIDGGRFRIFEVPIGSPTMFTAPLVGHDLYNEMGPKKLSSFLTKSRGPYVYILDIPQLTTLIARGEGRVAKSQLSFLLSVLTSGGNIVFCLMNDTSPFLGQVRELCRTEVHLDRKEGNFLLCGEKPFTPYYVAYSSENGGDVYLTRSE